MSFFFDVGETVIMENGDIYEIVHKVMYNDEEYVILKKEISSLEDLANVENDDKMSLCKVVFENNEVFLNPIEDEELMQIILGIK